MNPDNIANWFYIQGHRVLQTDSSYWVDVGHRIFQAFPYHWEINPSKDELHSLFFKYSAMGLRYSTPLSSPEGMVSYHVVYTGREYPLNGLSSKARYDVQKGLRSATMEPISFSRLAAEGWTTRLETLERQGRTNAENESWWRNLCCSADGIQGFETWAATFEEEIVASLIAFTDDTCCSILYQQSKTAHLKNSVNNALTFVFTQEALKKNITSVFYGLHSLDAPSSVDNYKFRMRYEAKPVRQRVVFHPFIRPIFNTISHSVLSRISKAFPRMTAFSKADGLVRFYLEGKRSLIHQRWPDCLLGKKELLISELACKKLQQWT